MYTKSLCTAQVCAACSVCSTLSTCLQPPHPGACTVSMGPPLPHHGHAIRDCILPRPPQFTRGASRTRTAGSCGPGAPCLAAGTPTHPTRLSHVGSPACHGQDCLSPKQASASADCAATILVPPSPRRGPPDLTSADKGHPSTVQYTCGGSQQLRVRCCVPAPPGTLQQVLSRVGSGDGTRFCQNGKPPW